MSKIICGLGLLLMAVQVQAAPMGFDGSAMAMGDFGPNWREVFINYALTPRDALGVSYTYMRSDDEEKTHD